MDAGGPGQLGAQDRQGQRLGDGRASRSWASGSCASGSCRRNQGPEGGGRKAGVARMLAGSLPRPITVKSRAGPDLDLLSCPPGPAQSCRPPASFPQPRLILGVMGFEHRGRAGACCSQGTARTAEVPQGEGNWPSLPLAEPGPGVGPPEREPGPSSVRRCSLFVLIAQMSQPTCPSPRHSHPRPTQFPEPAATTALPTAGPSSD